MIFNAFIDFIFGFYSTILNFIPTIPGQSDLINYVQLAINFFGNLTTGISFFFPINTLLWAIKFEIFFRVGIVIYRILRDVLQITSGGIIKK